MAGTPRGTGDIETRYSVQKEREKYTDGERQRGERQRAVRAVSVGTSCTRKPSTKDLSVTLGGYKTYVPLGKDRREVISLRLSFHVSVKASSVMGRPFGKNKKKSVSGDLLIFTKFV